ncbi:MAG: AmmeMemoRadiSam system protein B [Candidatus Omnitrophica bacterium]|nr:AmmeMemoRadiSam system protein B [Candidatus Omnitrophota bacterium]MDD5545686.1 AmmeMemoRadiSam system protein B [Candidatus Omnitrophota bacterium]
MTRNPAVAGQFYPGTKAGLSEEIEKYIIRDAGKIKAIGVVSPHAGYMYSGAVAGATLSSVELAGTCVVMGPNHTGRGRPFSIMTEGVWKLPSGDCEIDEILAKAILSNSRHLEEDEDAHRDEHSVEVQIPFLQALKEDVKIVPLVLADAGLEVYRDIGRAVAVSIKKSGRPATVIASSDMTHYEPLEAAKEKDGKAIEAIIALDEEALVGAIRRYRISMCGYAPVCVMLVAAKELGAKKAKLIKYQTSGEASGDYEAVVGYGGIIVY